MQIKNRSTSLGRAGLALCFLCILGASAQDRSTGREIKILFVIPARAFELGEQIPIRIELHNISKESLLVCRNIPEANSREGNTSFELDVIDQTGRSSVVTQKTAQLSSDALEGDVSAALNWWVLLPPGTFYGTVVPVQPNEFEFLKKPGKYRFEAKLNCLGGLPPEVANRLSNPHIDTLSIPFRIYSGSATWSSPWIQIKAKPSQ
jgi:hypothetical protein